MTYFPYSRNSYSAHARLSFYTSHIPSSTPTPINNLINTLDTITMSNLDNQAPMDPVVAAGATSHTGGFADAGASSSASAISPLTGSTAAPQSSSFAPSATSALGSAGVPFGYSGGVFGVGVAPGAPSGGMQSSPNVPAAGTSIDPSTGKPFSAGMTRAELEAKKAADLTGREQAARQLAGPGLATGAPPVDTPGRELPGGWGRKSLRNPKHKSRLTTKSYSCPPRSWYLSTSASLHLRGKLDTGSSRYTS
jgi:hypothetical protein